MKNLNTNFVNSDVVSFGNIQKIKISNYVLDLINRMTDNDFKSIKSSKWEEPFNWFNQILNEFKSNPILGYFYKSYTFLDDRIKSNIKVFNNLDLNIYADDNFIKTKETLSRNLDSNYISNLFNSTNITAGYFYEDFFKESYKNLNFELIITTFLILNFKQPKKTLTNYINNNNYFSQKIELIWMNWFIKELNNINGLIKNRSSDQNHRLFCVYFYNYVIDKYNLDHLLEKIEFIDKKYIEITEVVYNWEAIDEFIINNIMIDKNDFLKIFDWFDDYEIYKTIDDIKKFSQEKSIYYIIERDELYNNLLNNISQKTSKLVLNLIWLKTNNQIIYEKFEEFNILKIKL